MGITVRIAAVAGGLTGPAAGHERPLAVVTLAVWLLTASIGAYMLRRWILRGGLRRPDKGRPDKGRPDKGHPDKGMRPGSKEQGLPPAVIIGHFSLALTGLLLWAGFVVSGSDALAWAAAGVLMPAIGLGICTVTLWTPYPTYPDPFAASGTVFPVGGAGHTGGVHRGGLVTGPAGGMLAGPAENALAGRLTDDAMAQALTDDVLAGRLADDVLAKVLPGGTERGGGKPKGHLAPLIPAAHGMGALVTFLLAVLTAIGAR